MKSEDRSIVSRFAQIVAEHPERTAVVDGAGSITYRELDAASNALAAKILPRRSAGDTYVVTMLPRTRHFIVAVLASLKAGAAYVPVSPAYPDDRANDILDQTKAALLVTTAEIWKARKDALKIAAESVVLVDEMPVEAVAAIDESDLDKAAMVLFTSGTTGRPKGVVHTLRSLSAIAVAMVGRRDLAGRQRRYALVSDFSFIAATLVMCDCLWTGGELHVIGEDLRMNLGELAAYFNGRGIDISLIVTSMCVTMLNNFDVSGMEELQLGSEKLSGLGKEAVGSLRLMHLYGMTEMMPISEFRLAGGEQPPPVGRVIGDGGRLYVLDEAMQKVPAGTVGDIYAGSPRMAREYLGQPELSAERFVDDPFAPGERLLRTGDRGYIDERGDLVLCGRSDNMVKLRGLRIETGEVELAAQAFDGVGNCVCAVKPVNGIDQLCLYYEGPADGESLRRELVARLAEYMVPSRFIRMEKLPRNARGKIDRAALPDPVVDCVAEMVEPASDSERMLLDLARQQLGTDKFGVTDDLFAFGLTSLGAMKLVVEAEKLKIRIKTSGVMAGKSVRGALQHDLDVVWWYREYDPKKDVVLFVHGLALTKNIDRKLQLWAERFNVLVIEPTLEHYYRQFAGLNLAELMDRYFELVADKMPAGATLKACTGVSWGGKMAYLLSERWRQRTGQLPTAVMGDTLLTVDRTLVDAVLGGTLADWEKAHNLKFPDVFVQRLTMMFNVERTGAELPRYPGRTVLLHALKAQFPGDNAALWKDIAPNLEVVPVEGIHEDIALDTDKSLPIWRRVAEDIGRTA